MTRLYRLLTLIAQDNDMSIKSIHDIDWQNPIIAGYDIPFLEQAARRLPLKHYETFAIGEHEKTLKLVRKYRLFWLHDFLNDAFDKNPNLSNLIYER